MEFKRVKMPPATLGNKANYATIGRTPNALRIPNRADMGKSVSPAQYNENMRAIEAAVNNLPVPPMSVALTDTTDMWNMQGIYTGFQNFEIAPLLNDFGFDIVDGTWRVEASVGLHGVIPLNTTGGLLNLYGVNRMNFQDSSTFGTQRGIWNGEHDTGWDTPRFHDYTGTGSLHIGILQVAAGGYGLMRRDFGPGMGPSLSVNGRFWVLDEPGTPYDSNANGSPDTSEVDAEWDILITGYRMSDEYFNDTPEQGDGSGWPIYNLT